MQVLIHAEVSDHVGDIRFHKALIEWTKKEIPSLVTFDFDNFSEKTIIHYGIDLARQADRIMVVIDVSEGTNLGGLTHFMDQLIRLTDKNLKVVINGKQDQLHKMASILGDRYLQDLSLPQQKKLIKDFLSRQQAA